MSRLIKVTGKFHGIKYEVKPTTFEAHEVADELDKMYKEWFEENNAEHEKFFEDYKDDLQSDDTEKIAELFDIMPSLKLWQLDEDFRGKYVRLKAESSMSFEKPVPENIWGDKTCEYGTVQEAWDFFIGKRVVPQNGITSV